MVAMSTAQTDRMRRGVERRMRFRCTIQRNTASGSDPLNNPLPPTWSDLATDVPCYVWQGAGKGETQTADVLATLDVWNLILPVATDVTETDQITTITDAYGTQWNTATLNIRGVERRQTHLLVLCQEAR